MFVDQMPTKRVDLSTGDWVEIQYLSKGFRDEEKAYFSSLSVERDESNNIEFLKKFKEAEYRRIIAGVRKWSSDREITEENLKMLSDLVFDEILEAIEKYNGLSDDEVKN